LEYDIKYDVYKADVFAIAMVILELITLDKSKFYYNEAKTELKIDRISFDISSMGKNYSEPFINLLKHCLHPAPALRSSIQEATDQLNAIRKSMKSITYCIRLQEDDDKTKKGTSKR
jgi:serine/threonine protein kinase